ncbi:MAG: protein phosphatase 2C domain-containing protein [Anaerolineae bacterium]
MTLDRARDALRHLFAGAEDSQDGVDDTKEMAIVDPAGSDAIDKGPVPSTHDLQVGIASDPGRIRDHNEDASLAWHFVLAQLGRPPLHVGLFIVADGMGGHARGEQASALAIRTVAAHVIQSVNLPLLVSEDGTPGSEPIHDILADGMRMAHEVVAQRLPEAGTTLTMALVLGDGAYIAHVGDSRAYQGERGRLTLLTQDHSVAARLLEMGHASPEEVASQRNILYRALGQGVQVEPDILYHDLSWGQYLLICCDGLWGKVTDAEIAAIIDNAPTPDLACQALVKLANQNGGEDNISVVLAARGWPLPDREAVESPPAEEGA